MNQNRLKFVLIELQLATTFLEVANIADEPSARARNVAHARRAQEAAKDVLTMVHCTEQQRADIEAGLAAIQERLDAAMLGASHQSVGNDVKNGAAVTR